jgi:RimJ/RimL family protein N-acetyltransferase
MAATTLRFYEPADAPLLFDAARESVVDVYPWLPWCHPAYTAGEARAWIERQVHARQHGDELAFAIVDSASRLVGGCGINGINAMHRFANLGYWVRSSAAGRGLAPAAVRQLAAWAFVHTSLIRLEIVVACKNTRSQRVAEKAGAEREGVLRDRLILHGEPHDAVIYSITRSRWGAP